ncbi:MAG: hypothetical protein GF401_03420 [Chitinivibrionales bacterium]|nr:hypothetical protein [Chitinivibrionales bacterium]
MNGPNVYEHIFVSNKSPQELFNEVAHICSLIDPSLNTPFLKEVYNDIVALFRGEYEGYRECTTRYHDLSHTLGVFLAMARLIHGAVVTGELKEKSSIINGLIASLFHDAGLIQEQGEREGTGASHSSDHERRGIEFMRSYLGAKNYSPRGIENISHIITRTNLTLSPDQIPDLPADVELLCKCMGTADLIAQMADRLYLEKLLYLYREFEEAGVRGFISELDLLKKTEAFYKDLSQNRLKRDLGNITPLLRDHFRARFGIDRNLYQEYIDKNIGYLKTILESHEDDYRRMLRRGGIVATLKDDFI